MVTSSLHKSLWNSSSLLLALSILSFFCSFTGVVSQIKVLYPPELVEAVEASSDGSDILNGATATFGAPSYGESFVGKLFYATSNTTYCTDDYKNEIRTALESIQGDGLRKIFVVERGGCTFVKKTEIAQRLGADAVIVLDLNSSTWTRKDMITVIMADDGYGGNVRIPSVMLTKEDGQLLLNALKHQEVVVQLQWSLPQKSIVSVEFWTESGSGAGQRFLKDYAYHANILRGRLKFTPHYSVYGLKSGLVDGVNLKLCSPNDPELCSNPPDVLGSQVTGNDVLEEDARQLCLWDVMATEVDGIADSKYSSEWWEYVRKFADSCPIIPPPGPRFSTECSYRVMSLIPSIDQIAVRNCTKTRGKELLNREKTNRAWSNLAIRINGAKFSGSLDPIQVSKAVCSAFQSPPAECSRLTGLPPPVVLTSGISASTISMALLIILVLGGVILYFYQRYMRKAMRATLRHEVMLEVRSQLQEYHQLDEDNDTARRQTRPLMMS